MVQERGALLTRDQLLEVIKQYFTAAGYTEIEAPEGVDLALRKGDRSVGIRLLKFSKNPARDRRLVRSEIYRLLRERPCDELYIAVEEISFARLPPSYEFKESGIGLLKVDGSSVEVAIPATPIRARSAEAEGGGARESFHRGAGWSPELVSGAQFMEIVRELKALLEEAKRQARWGAGATSEGGTLVAAGRGSEGAVERRVGEEGAAEQSLPVADFLRDNPWLKIIGGKGGD